MTAINNLKGHIVKDGKVVYSEKLEDDLVFAVVEMYEKACEKENYSCSSSLFMKATITTGQMHTWSNGVVSLIEAERLEKIELKDQFCALRTLKTSQGFSVFESASQENIGKKFKIRRVKWIVEVPKDALANFFKV